MAASGGTPEASPNETSQEITPLSSKDCPVPPNQVDVLWKAGSEGSCRRMCIELVSKAFCTSHASVQNEVFKEVMDAVNILVFDSKSSSNPSLAFKRPPQVVSDGLLGSGSNKIVDLQATTDQVARELGDGIRQFCKVIDDVGDALQPFALEQAFAFSHRAHFVLHQAGGDNRVASPITIDAAQRWTTIFGAQALMVIVFLGPGKATMALTPHNTKECIPYSVQLTPGSIVVVRPDLLSCRLKEKNGQISLTSIFMCSGVVHIPRSPAADVLDTWVMEYLRQRKENENEDSHDIWSIDLPREWQLSMNHNFFRGDFIQVLGQGIKVPSTHNSDEWFNACTAGADVICSVPFDRWDNNKTFEDEEDAWKRGKHYCRHGGFTEGLTLFDPKAFGIQVMEAAWMAPHQRMVLETGYEALHGAGYVKKNLYGKNGAHVCGFGSLQWNFVDKSELGEAGAFGACGEAAAVMAARLSFCVGLKGNCFTVDTEGASGLTALHAVGEAIQPKSGLEPDGFGIATACYLNLCPVYLPRMCAAGLLSRKGRCFTFDKEADGYTQTDGVAACVLKPMSGDSDVPEDNNHGLLASMVMNQNGHGASLHAPSGPAEQDVVVKAVQNALITTYDMDACECHGAGAYLPDAVEVAAMVRSHRSEDCSEPFIVMAAKTNYGNSVWAAGLNAFIKVLWNSAAGRANPLCHLNFLNPHIDMLDEAPAQLPVECVPFRSEAGSWIGTMARGFAGTNVYAISHGYPKHEGEEEEEGEEEPIASDNFLWYWPGGGGDVPDEMKEMQSYEIVCSTNDWKPTKMDKVGDREFTYTVTVGEEGYAEFQIWCNGDYNITLHPGWPQAESSAPIFGPESGDNVQGLHWLVCNNDLSPGSSGDKYQIVLTINGRWKSVSWTKVEAGNLDLMY